MFACQLSLFQNIKMRHSRSQILRLNSAKYFLILELSTQQPELSTKNTIKNKNCKKLPVRIPLSWNIGEHKSFVFICHH